MTVQSKIGRVTSEELTMIRDYIMLPHMLTMSDNSLQQVRRSSNLFKTHFEQIIHKVMDRITKELASIRHEFKQRNIKVFEDETFDGVIYHKYVCRGYEDRFGVVREVLRTEMSFRFAEYASNIFNVDKK